MEKQYTNSKFQVSFKKILKLTNAVSRNVSEEEFENIEIILVQLDNYIMSKGGKPIGPLIQYTASEVENEEIGLKVTLFRQVDKYIHRVEFPYKTWSAIRVPNCMYVRYVGQNEYFGYAYDKLRLTAFEENIEIRDSNYIVFVNKNDDEVVVDVFSERIGD